MTIQEIEPLVRDFNAARRILSERVERCQAEQQTIVRRLRGGIQSAAARTRDAHARLEAAIAANPELFTKPRTLTIEGTKVGVQKGKGRLLVTDKAVALIRRHLPEQADALIKTRESVNRPAVSALSGTQLKKIGCSLIDAGDRVLIATPRDDLDKLVDALLQDATEETTTAQS